MIRLLSERGVDADYHDFYIHKLHHTRKYSFDKSSINLNESIGNYDLIILSTDHDEYDYEYPYYYDEDDEYEYEDEEEG